MQIPFLKRITHEPVKTPAHSLTLPFRCMECNGTMHLTLIEPHASLAMDNATYTCENCGREASHSSIRTSV